MGCGYREIAGYFYAHVGFGEFSDGKFRAKGTNRSLDIRETPDQGVAGTTGASAAGGMERVPPPDLPSGLTLRNAAYALQWWVFAVFALWMWVKMVRDDYRRHQPVPAEGTGESADVGVLP